jgi:putative flavoprotein involved in K+ transport
MTESIDTVVIGGGQAGLATSHELTEAGVEHVVLERDVVASTWRGRWDSFCVVSPNSFINLPGGAYDGDDPEGFMLRDDLVAHLEHYAEGFGAPVRSGVDVTSLRPAEGGFALETSNGPLSAGTVVVATGSYRRPHRSAGAAGLPADLAQLDVEDYRNPGSVPEGKVLIIGSGQSGCQLAEELAAAGREVFLAAGRTASVPRRLGEHDVFWWLIETGFINQPVATLPVPEARLFGNPIATGRDGGHDLSLQTLAAAGVNLLGHFVGAEGSAARFAPDLADSVAWGNERVAQLRELVFKAADAQGITRPEVPDMAAVTGTPTETLDLRGFGGVIHAGGFRPDYGGWIDVPGAFDRMGFPVHHDGASDAADGLYFVGTHFLRTRKSSLLWGVGEDAAIVAGGIAARAGISR